MAISGDPQNIWKVFGSASVTTTIQPVWTPATGKVVQLMGFSLKMGAGTAQFDITDGTAAAAGTISTHSMVNTDPTLDFDYGRGKLLSAANSPLGIKARAGAGTISGTFYGREFVPA